MKTNALSHTTHTTRLAHEAERRFDNAMRGAMRITVAGLLLAACFPPAVAPATMPSETSLAGTGEETTADAPITLDQALTVIIDASIATGAGALCVAIHEGTRLARDEKRDIAEDRRRAIDEAWERSAYITRR